MTQARSIFFNDKKYCQLGIDKHERPQQCGKPLPDGFFDCSECPAYIKAKGITFRGLRIAKKHKGTQNPEIIPKETFIDRRFKNANLHNKLA